MDSGSSLGATASAPRPPNDVPGFPDPNKKTSPITHNLNVYYGTVALTTQTTSTFPLLSTWPS